MTTGEGPNAPGSGCLLVLGMHRSGTSAITGTLARLGLGVGAPSELHPPDDGNPAGYWEPAELIRIDDALLESWGGHQRNPQVGARARSLEELPDPLAARMRDYARRWDSRVPFVWKDPRLCITLPLWRPLLPIRGFVVAARDPGGVAASLEAREGMPPPAGLALWEVYVRSLLAALGETPRLVVRYDDLLMRSAEVVDRLAQFAAKTVGLAGPDRRAALEGIEARRVAPPNWSAVSPAQRELYRLLCEGSPAPQALSSSEVVSLVDSAAALGAQLTRQTFVLGAAEAKIERLREKLAAAAAPARRSARGPLGRLRRWAGRLRPGR